MDTLEESSIDLKIIVAKIEIAIMLTVFCHYNR